VAMPPLQVAWHRYTTEIEQTLL